jgi:hypothetical protein
MSNELMVQTKEWMLLLPVFQSMSNKPMIQTTGEMSITMSENERNLARRNNGGDKEMKGATNPNNRVFRAW